MLAPLLARTDGRMHRPQKNIIIRQDADERLEKKGIDCSIEENYGKWSYL